MIKEKALKTVTVASPLRNRKIPEKFPSLHLIELNYKKTQTRHCFELTLATESDSDEKMTLWGDLQRWSLERANSRATLASKTINEKFDSLFYEFLSFFFIIISSYNFIVYIPCSDNDWLQKRKKILISFSLISKNSRNVLRYNVKCVFPIWRLIERA